MKCVYSVFLVFILVSCGKVDHVDFVSDAYFSVVIGTGSSTFDDVVVGRVLLSNTPSEYFPDVSTTSSDGFACGIYVDDNKVYELNIASRRTVVLGPHNDLRFRGESNTGVYVFVVKYYGASDVGVGNAVCLYKDFLHAGEFDLSIEAEVLYAVLGGLE
ncbi:hypothetical protein H5P28_10870 [Ruficoccus amylovorans]|uniref:Lipoprotein n=1 Tax=Ruficoccus amylovorans TaxID=1804625 RepID=A0A842HE17_9BACT|nr:hypothetical protein [Ruficoccus amylovorans]MBC2594763.1 hypothetical protein [Ruficoccus amylovorans]